MNFYPSLARDADGHYRQSFGSSGSARQNCLSKHKEHYMNRMLVLLALLIFAGSLPAFIAEGESNLFEITGTPVGDHFLPPATQITGMQPASPNPFRGDGQTRVVLTVTAGETAICGIYNLSGQLVLSRAYSSGSHQFAWDGSDSQGNPCASGIYLIRLKSRSHSSSAKLVLIK